MTPLETPLHPPTADPPTQRPQLKRTTGARGWSVVAAVLFRELKAKLLIPGYLWSTLAFAAVAFFTPAVLNRGGNDAAILAIPPESRGVMRLLASSAQGAWSIREVADNAAAEALIADGVVDAYLTPSADSGWSLVSSGAVNPHLLESLQSLLVTHSLRTAAVDAGSTPEQLNEAAAAATVTPVSLEHAAVDMPALLFALGIGATIVFIVLLWGATMANDVVQEKTTRVVEILLATLRPWQLLAGKIVAITIIGILQVTAVLGATWAGLELFGDGISFDRVPVELVVVGVVSVLIGVPLLTSFMAAMAARVDHPDDVSTATQPVYLLLMVPFAAVVFVAFERSHATVLEVLSYTPITNIFAMPVSVALGDVAPWQLLISLVITLVTLAASIALAGRIYSNSVLRSGTTVSFWEALSST